MYYTYIMVMFPKVAAGEEVAALRLFYFLLTAPVVVAVAVVVEEEEEEVAVGAPYLDEILLHDDLLAQGKKVTRCFRNQRAWIYTSR